MNNIVKLYTGTYDCLNRIIKEEGIGALWNGVYPSLILVSNPTIQFFTYERCRRAIESIASIISINESFIPPTINHSNYDEEINKDLNLTLNKYQDREVNIAISNTFGFRGHNTSIIFKKYEK